ncbi:MAG: methyltransferase domain-containing protein [Candidatus Bathyarchaeia archaeon]
MVKRDLLAEFYKIIKGVIGDSLHPGGLDLTRRVGEVARIREGSRVLDLACGMGASAQFLIKKFKCEIIGFDLLSVLIKMAKSNIVKELSLGKYEFITGEARFLPFINSCFDAVICESAFSLFSDKSGVLGEIYRVLKSRGNIVVTNIIFKKDVPMELKKKITFVPCIAGAETLQNFRKLLEQKCFVNIYIEDHTEKLIELGFKLLLSGYLTEASIISPDQLILKRLFNEDILGYALIVATKP